MLKEVLSLGSGLSKLEEKQLTTLITYPLWKEEGAHYRSTGTSSNPTKMEEPDFTGKV